MNEEAQRIAIAEADGFVQIRSGAWKKGNGLVVKDPAWLPDYLNDLNEMHDVTTKMSGERKIRYRLALIDIAGAQHYHDATAAQRAEAYLKTIGKWVES